MTHLTRFVFAIALLVVLVRLGFAQTEAPPETAPWVVVLGVAQDAGYPQAVCRKECCRPAWLDESLRRDVSCLGIVDPQTGQRWLIDATPSLPDQMHALDALSPPRDPANVSQPALDGILLTHAHIGHYTGLQHLGREVVGARGVPVYAMPRMRAFLRTNGPWSQLVELGNIEIRSLEDDTPVQLNERIVVTPLLVPHRDEFSETVGFRIDGPDRSVLFIPDIDKWEKWNRSLIEEIAAVDVAYLDGTFYRNGEIPGRDMAEIPHPFIEETMAILEDLPVAERSKVRFIHMNHTNPALREGGAAEAQINAKGFRVAHQHEVVSLSNE